ncbi:MAG: glycosyltransferase family 2 protein [Chitinophagaceae bacterium]|nr:MAG: glycosyltransferase family 2 protein [Chitinophagaceae bacterium]
MKIAVLLTTFNRKQKTLECLQTLRSQDLPAGCAMDVFLTDDASSDGTADAVKALYPETHLYNGDGHFYWAGGMRYTWNKAIPTNPDYYLLLNDDTTLFAGAVKKIIQLAGSQPKPTVIIGNTADQASGKLSYGGWRLLRKRFWKSERVYDEKQMADCDFANANILLVPREVVNRLGILADHFTHSLADYDYTYKVKKAGFGLKSAPGIIGYCTDDHGNNWKSQGSSTLKERINYLMSVKGIAYREHMLFIRDHFPLSYPSEFLKLWMKTFFPIVWDRLKH